MPSVSIEENSVISKNNCAHAAKSLRYQSVQFINCEKYGTFYQKSAQAISYKNGFLKRMLLAS